MPIPNRALSLLTREIERAYNAVKVPLSATIADAEGKKPTGMQVYRAFFGTHQPVSFQLSPLLEKIVGLTAKDEFYQEKMRWDKYNTFLTIPLRSDGDKKNIAYTIKEKERGKLMAIPDFAHNPTPELVDYCRSVMTHHFGPEYLDSIDRYLAAVNRIHNLDDRVRNYASRCVMSLPALYNMLPPLHTLVPNNTISHIRSPRNAKDPTNYDPLLLEDLNLLATLKASLNKMEE